MENIVNTTSKPKRAAMLRAFNVDGMVGAADDQQPSAAVVGNGLLAFTKGVSRINRQDVKSAYLYATMRADKSQGSYYTGKEWFDVFNAGMEEAGWVGCQKDHRIFKSEEKHLSMEKIAVEILKGAIISAAMGPAGSLNALETAQKALGSLGNSDEALKVFESYSTKDKGGNFGIGAVVEEDEDVAVVIAMVSYHSDDRNSNFLFGSWDKSKLEIFQSKVVYWIDDYSVNRRRDVIRNYIDAELDRRMADFSI